MGPQRASRGWLAPAPGARRRSCQRWARRSTADPGNRARAAPPAPGQKASARGGSRGPPLPSLVMMAGHRRPGRFSSDSVTTCYCFDAYLTGDVSMFHHQRALLHKVARLLCGCVMAVWNSGDDCLSSCYCEGIYVPPTLVRLLPFVRRQPSLSTAGVSKGRV